MYQLLANYKTKKFDLMNKNGDVVPGVANLLIPIEIIGALEQGSNSYMKLKTFEGNQTRTFEVRMGDISSMTDFNRVLVDNLYIINYKLVNHLREFINYRLQDLQTNGAIRFNHKSLGFWEDTDGSTIFLLEQNRTNRGFSKYFNDSLAFKMGTKEDYLKFIDSEILPYIPMQLAFAMGLSSVTASYLKDYADVGTIVINFCGASSTGKSTTAQFIASLWADPRIGNDSLVRTFNSTQGAMMQSIEGFNGVPIILDDATTAAYMNKTNLVYQLAQGEARARLIDYGRSIRQGQEWSGCAIITSELPILSESETRQGLIARVIDTNDIVWTNSGEHAVRVKNFIKSNYGHLGQEFANYFLTLTDAEIKERFVKAREEMLRIVKKKDNLPERIVNKLAILYSTAKIANECFMFELDLAKILDILVAFDQVDVENRHIAVRGYFAIKDYIEKHHHKFDKYDSKNTKLESSKGVLMGVIIYHKETMDVSIPAENVKEILRSNRIYEYKPVLKYWAEHQLIIQQSNRNTINISKLEGRVVKFVLERHEDTIMPWLYEAPPYHKSEQRPPVYKADYNDEDAIASMFESFDKDEDHAS